MTLDNSDVGDESTFRWVELLATASSSGCWVDCIKPVVLATQYTRPCIQLCFLDRVPVQH